MSTYIIAEAGVNHNGDIDKAKQLVLIAKNAGCDCVKFQTFLADKIVTKTAAKARYQIENTGNAETQYEMLKKLELSKRDYKELRDYCKKVGIDFMSTPFDEEAVDILEELGVTAYKLSSGDITNKSLIQYVGLKQKKIFLSTGMSTLDEVRKAIQWLQEVGNKNIVLLHCTSNYPAAYKSVNMQAMKTMHNIFSYEVGYSDHTNGVEIPFMAVSMGATVIEKHFTYDKNAEGPDHKASLEPNELDYMVKGIRHIEEAMGDGVKKPTLQELETRKVARKSLIWTHDMKVGDIISQDDICCKRPGVGIAPERKDDLIGKVISRNCYMDDLIKEEDFIDD